MEYQPPKQAVLMFDIDDSFEVRNEKIDAALKRIYKNFPDLAGKVLCYRGDRRTSRTYLAGGLISLFDGCDTLFCNTCGEEKDHIYRFLRAIAKNEGLQIVPVHSLP